MKLPIFQTSTPFFTLMQNKWKSILDPIIANPTSQSSILKNIALISGTNTINHLLGRRLIGWKIVRQRADASIYDQQDNNQMQDLTLILISNNPVNVDLEVF